MDLTQLQIDLLWEQVKNYALQQSGKWPKNRDDFLQTAALNVCNCLKNADENEDPLKVAMNAVSWSHSHAAKIIIERRVRNGRKAGIDIRDCEYGPTHDKIECKNNNSIEDKEEIELIKKHISMIEKDNVRITMQRLLEGKSRVEIAAELNTTRQNISLLIQAGREFLKQRME